MLKYHEAIELEKKHVIQTVVNGSLNFVFLELR